MSLQKTFGGTTHHTAATHPSLPNYLLIAGGRTFGVTDDAALRSHPIAGTSVFGAALAMWTHNLSGVMLEMREEYDQAKRYYGRAIHLDKNFEPAQANMRRIFELFNFGSSQEPFNMDNK